MEASDALLAIERYAGVKPVELHKIRRQDPSLARDNSERASIKRYRSAVEAAAAGRLAESFKRLDQMGAVVGCGLGEQADKLADEYVRLAEQNASAVVVSQTWGEVHRVNTRVREALKAKGLLGASDTSIQALERVDLTNAQKRDERFYPQGAVIVFNQKVREADAGAKGKLSGILKTGLLVEVGGRFVNVSNKMLDRISVCQTREIAVAPGERLHLKANRKLASGGRVTNGELVAVTVDGRDALNRLATFYLIPYFDLGVRLDADGKDGVNVVCGSVHYLLPDGSSLLSRCVYGPEALRAASLRRTNPEQFVAEVDEGYIKGVKVESPAVISVNGLSATLAVNNLLARIHPFRIDPNSEIRHQWFDLINGIFGNGDGGEPCRVLKRYVGRGDIEPFLDCHFG